MALKMLVGAWPHCNQAQLHLQEPLMPCGLSFLNRDFPPAFFFLSLSFHIVTGLAFRVWFGFLTEKSRAWNPFQIVSPAPCSHTTTSCDKGPSKEPLLLLGFLGRREPHWDSTPRPPLLNVLSESVQIRPLAIVHELWRRLSGRQPKGIAWGWLPKNQMGSHGRWGW